jgi:hypothetical protein
MKDKWHQKQEQIKGSLNMQLSAVLHNRNVSVLKGAYLAACMGMALPLRGITASTSTFPIWSAVTVGECYPDELVVVTTGNVNIHM